MACTPTRYEPSKICCLSVAVAARDLGGPNTRGTKVPGSPPGKNSPGTRETGCFSWSTHGRKQVQGGQYLSSSWSRLTMTACRLRVLLVPKRNESYQQGSNSRYGSGTVASVLDVEPVKTYTLTTSSRIRRAGRQILLKIYSFYAAGIIYRSAIK